MCVCVCVYTHTHSPHTHKTSYVLITHQNACDQVTNSIYQTFILAGLTKGAILRLYHVNTHMLEHAHALICSVQKYAHASH